MTAITLVVTNAGRAALVNAAAGGTNAVTIAQAGFTSLGFAAAASMTALPGEFSRVASLAGAVVDPDTIHLVLRDDSSAAYALRGFGLYLADGTLFALYGQAAPILDKSASATALIAVDVRFADITAAALNFGPANFLNPPATTTVVGVVELATPEEAATGTDAIRAVTPAGLRGAIDARFGAGAASAFVRTLLNAASAAAFRATLAIKSAALRDEGAGGGLDADRVDGLDTHNLPTTSSGGAWPALPIINAAGTTDIGRQLDLHSAAGNPGDFTVRLAIDSISGGLTINGNRIWHIGNDGAGSGLDADLLDGQDGSHYTNIPARLGYTPANRAGDSFGGMVAAITITAAGAGLRVQGAAGGGPALLQFTDHPVTAQWGAFSVNAGGWGNWSATGLAVNGNGVWHAGNDGAGSGLDADLLDGRDAGSFANASHTHSAADLAPAFAAQQLANDGWQELPGGLLLQWGRNRVYAAGETTVAWAFPRAFAAAPFVVQLTGVNPTGATNRDMFPQLQSSDANGASARLQLPDSGSGRPLDGFDWFAIGLAGTGPGSAPGTGGGGGGGGGGDPGTGGNIV